MARNSKGGKKYKRTKKFTSNQKNRELVLKQSDQKYGFLTENMGDLRFKVLCDDGKIRVGHVPGRFRGRYFFRKDDYVLVSIRSFQPSMCDLLYKYNAQEVVKLREKDLIVMIDQMEDNDINLNIGIQDQLEEESESEAESESEKQDNQESHTDESDSDDDDDDDMMERINNLKLMKEENEKKEGRIIVNGYDITDL